MIDSLKLKEICKRYGINYEKLVGNNSNVLEYGEYGNICYVLDYLRDEAKIAPSNIEKCPSILYFEVGNIKSNYEFLKKEQITNYSVEGCLHILSTEPSELRKTYKYILENYGIRYLNAITTILSVPVSRIQEIEIKFPEFKKKNVLQAAYSRFSIEEIVEIVEVCRKNGIEIKGSVFHKPAKEIEKIVELCKKNGIVLTGSVFYKSAEEIEEIVEVCKANEIELTGSAFIKSAEEVKKIVEVCKTNRIKLTGKVFLKSAEEIKKIVKVCRTNGIEISGNVFQKSAEEIKKIVKVCKENGIEITGSVFYKSAEEIIEIIEVCKANGIEISGSVFLKSAEEIEKIVEVCKANGIEVKGNVFHKSAEEIEKIVEVCKTNGIELSGSVFYKSVEQLQENIDYVRENYGKGYLKPLIVSKNIKTLKKVLPYLQEKGVLETILTSTSILTLTLEEIKERQAFIERTGGTMVFITAGSGIPKFNSIFGLSRKNYAKRVEQEKNNRIEDR